MSTTASAQRHARSRPTPPGLATFEPPDGLVCRPPLDPRGRIRIGLLLSPGADAAEIVEPRDGAYGSEALGRWGREGLHDRLAVLSS